MKQSTFIHQVSLKLVAVAVACGLAGAAQGALYTFNSTGSATIPDYPNSGLASQFTYSHPEYQITDVYVTFTTSGGRNGDLYAFLSHGSDSLILLNRVGVANGTSGSTLYNYGYSGAGFNNITLTDSGSGNIHNYGGSVLNSTPTVNGSYLADGQTANPVNAPTGFNAGGGGLTFSSQFGGDNPNGTWTLFFADVSGGSIATLDSWSVGITAVPEPVNVALGVFAGVVLLVAVCRRIKQSRKLKAAIVKC
jgi:hypothetical protein